MDEMIAVICRGELATYIAIKAFRGFDNVKIMYDNRGIPIEESLLSHGNNPIHRLNRRTKKWAIKKVKDKCDLYNFVTNNMRTFCIKEYGFDPNKRYTIIPTLFRSEPTDVDGFNLGLIDKGMQNNYIVFSYIGSLAAWQSKNELIQTIEQILKNFDNSLVVFLTKDNCFELERLKNSYQSRLIINNVPHKLIKHYLSITDYGLIMRDENIVNKVAAPTKIAEFLSFNVKVLYKGAIGIIDDLKTIGYEDCFIRIDDELEWIETIRQNGKKKENSNPNFLFFDMNTRQKETYDTFLELFGLEVKNTNG